MHARERERSLGWSVGSNPSDEGQQFAEVESGGGQDQPRFFRGDSLCFWAPHLLYYFPSFPFSFLFFYFFKWAPGRIQRMRRVGAVLSKCQEYSRFQMPLLVLSRTRGKYCLCCGPPLDYRHRHGFAPAATPQL